MSSFLFFVTTHSIKIYVQLHNTEYWLFFIEGIEVELPSKEAAASQMMVLSGHFDLPARSAVLEQVTHTGHDGCCYCTHKGKTVSTSGRGHVIITPGVVTTWECRKDTQIFNARTSIGILILNTKDQLWFQRDLFVWIVIWCPKPSN